ncbi:uncharacterized protein [Diabrotica undecimpunctata]|uniref:uncharacterized protein isoform X1 n=1 Tax=Diabrotica undecimpunctata TaxID=50387 RepID=UPI003B640B52
MINEPLPVKGTQENETQSSITEILDPNNNVKTTAIQTAVQFKSTSKKFEPAIEAKLKEEDESKIPSIWFSPRLGRKKRNLKDEGYKPTEQEQQELLEAFEESPLALVAINGNDRLICKNVQGKRSSFIPRLGRNVEEDVSSNDKWLETDNSAEYVIQRSPPFAPRLGRRFSPYFPRLGREV